MARSRSAAKTNNSANIGFEAKVWQAADKLRSNMDAAEYNPPQDAFTRGDKRHVLRVEQSVWSEVSNALAS